MMVGYAANHDAQVYRMWNPVTRKVHVTRDIIWMNQMLFTKKVDEMGKLPDGIEADVEEADPEAGKSTNSDDVDAESVNSDGDEEGDKEDLDMGDKKSEEAEAMSKRVTRTEAGGQPLQLGGKPVYLKGTDMRYWLAPLTLCAVKAIITNCLLMNMNRLDLRMMTKKLLVLVPDWAVDLQTPRNCMF